MSKSALNEFLGMAKKAEDNVEKLVSDTDAATGSLKDDEIGPATEGERSAENEAGMEAMHTQMIDNTEMGVTDGENVAPDLSTAKPSGEDPKNEEAGVAATDNNDGNPPLLTDVEKRVMKEGKEAVVVELAGAVLKYANEVVEEMCKIAEEAAGAEAAELDVRKAAALRTEIENIDAYAKEAACAYKEALEGELTPEEAAIAEAAMAEEAAAAEAAAGAEAEAGTAATDEAMSAAAMGEEDAMPPVGEEDAVALAEALAEEGITPEELMMLAEGVAEGEQAPIAEKAANLNKIATLLGCVSRINNLRAAGRGRNIKSASIAKQAHMLNIVKGLKAAARK